MNTYDFTLSGTALTAMPSGALWMPDCRALCVSDLHLGKSDRIARRAGRMVPPYENRATLEKLDADIAATAPATVICLGDSFDDLDAAGSLTPDETLWITRLQAGRDWVWIEGNHDPGPVALGGSHKDEWTCGGLAFRHIATAATGEVSGHYHPKLTLPGTGRGRACFLVDAARLIMPAYGAYTGGLNLGAPVLQSLMAPKTLAILTGRKALPVPMPRT